MAKAGVWLRQCIFIATLILFGHRLRLIGARADDVVSPPNGNVLVGVAQPTPPPSSYSAIPNLMPPGWLPESLALGSWRLSALKLTPTLYAQVDWFGEGNNGWGGHFSPPLQESRYFFEHSNEGGLNASLDLAHYGKLTGRISAVFAMTGGGLNAGGTNYGDIQARNYSIEDAYLKWSSGDLFPSLGRDAFSLVGGRYTYRIGDGFLFYDGASGGGNRDAAWLAPHHAFAQSGILRFNYDRVTVEGFYLSPSDHPYSYTELAGVNTEVRVSELIETGFTYVNTFHSDMANRLGLNLMYGRVEGRPFRDITDFYLTSSVAVENSGSLANALGWYVTPSYTFSQFSWQPILYYRYASFSGGGHKGNRNFDPLFYGTSDWGTWSQGEILEDWIATNSNLNSHQIRLNLAPSDKVNFNLIYYHFSLDSRTQNLVRKPAKPVTSTNLADEIDFITDLSITNWWNIAITFSVNVPGRAAHQISGGEQTWVQSGIWSNWQF